MINPIKYSSKKGLDPGIMGWYKYVPFMQCYHGVVSLNHELKGQLRINGSEHVFDDGFESN